MKKILAFVSVLTSCISLSQAQVSLTQTIRGTVVDQAAQFPLFGVNVVVLGTDEFTGTSTDTEGNFKIEGLPIGRHSLQFSYVGYKEQLISNILVNSAKESILQIELEEEVSKLEEVVVKSGGDKANTINELANISARTMSVEEMSRFSGTLSDPARMSQSYAGVSGASDDRNDIIIRGNSPTGVLWRMEGIDIPSPNHFATLGTTGGPVSMLNINNLKNSDFITSAFPAEYGNATSGVFDLQLRNGNYENYEFLGQIGFNGFEFGAEGPLGMGNNSSFLLNYRYSTLAVFNFLGVDFGLGSAIPQYQDLTFKVNIPTEKAGRFSIWGAGGLSYIEFEPDSLGNENNLYSDDEQDSEFRSNTAFGGLTHTYFFNDNAFSKFNFSISGTRNTGTVDTLTPNQDFAKIWGQKLDQIKFSFNWKYNQKLSAKNRITTGLIYDIFQVEVSDSSRAANQDFEPNFSFDGNLSLLQSFIHWQHKFNDQLTLNNGLHFQYLFFNGSYALEPRLGLKYQLDSRNTFNLGFGLHSQMQPLTIYFQERIENNGDIRRPNEELDFFRSIHSVAGWDRLLGKDLRLKMEVYHQYLYDIAVDIEPSEFSMLNTGADFGFPDRVDLENSGTGHNYGAELTLEKFFNKNYYFLATASVFESKYRGSDDKLRNTLFNGNYTFNLLGGKEFKITDKFTLTLDAKVTYAGGRRYTPIDLASSIASNDEVLFEERAFENRYPNYFRTDFKIGYRRNGKKTTQTFSVDLQNVTGRSNIFSIDFNNLTGEIETTYQRGFFPGVRYQILF